MAYEPGYIVLTNQDSFQFEKCETIKAVVLQHNSNPDDFIVQCPNCNMFVSGKTAQAAVAAWNEKLRIWRTNS